MATVEIRLPSPGLLVIDICSPFFVVVTNIYELILKSLFSLYVATEVSTW